MQLEKLNFGQLELPKPELQWSTNLGQQGALNIEQERSTLTNSEYVQGEHDLNSEHDSNNELNLSNECNPSIELNPSENRDEQPVFV